MDVKIKAGYILSNVFKRYSVLYLVTRVLHVAYILHGNVTEVYL